MPPKSITDSRSPLHHRSQNILMAQCSTSSMFAYVSFTPPLPKSITDSSMISMLHLLNVCESLALLDLTAPKVAAGKKGTR